MQRNNSFPLPPSLMPSFTPQLNQLEGMGSAVISPAGYGAEPQPKTNSVHSRAVRKPLVEIILSTPKCMFLLCQLHRICFFVDVDVLIYRHRWRLDSVTDTTSPLHSVIRLLLMRVQRLKWKIRRGGTVSTQKPKLPTKRNDKKSNQTKHKNSVVAETAA